MRASMSTVVVIAWIALSSPAFGSPPTEDSNPRHLNLPIEGVVTNPDWTQKPSGDDVARLYPALAQFLGISGLTAITCAVNVQGLLEQCRLDREIPAGLGFGEAALLMAPSFRMRPKLIDGVAVPGGEVTVPISFILPSDDPRADASPASGSPAPTPGAVAAAARLVAAVGGLSQQEQQLKQLLQTAEQNIDLDEQEAKGAGNTRLAIDAYEQSFAAVAPKFAAALTTTYAGLFSESELDRISAFMESPVGRAWISRGADIRLANQRADRVLMKLVQDDARRRFCLQVACVSPPSPNPSPKK